MAYARADIEQNFERLGMLSQHIQREIVGGVSSLGLLYMKFKDWRLVRSLESLARKLENLLISCGEEESDHRDFMFIKEMLERIAPIAAEVLKMKMASRMSRPLLVRLDVAKEKIGDLYEDVMDSIEAEEAMKEAREKGTVPWEQVKTEIGLQN